MANLSLSIEKTLRHEGIYSNDPADPGGETWQGISRKYHPEWVGWISIDAAKVAGARPETLEHDPALHRHVLTFYIRQFADPIYDRIENQEILDEVFDFGFNVNPPNAVRALQESLKSLVAGPIVIDGRFGPATLGAVNAADPGRLLKEFRARQAVYYVEAILRRFVRILRELGTEIPEESLARATKYATTFALGWLRRVME